jgi:hypothetical protein
MQITLKDDLKNLRVSFHLKLAKKRDLRTDKEEVSRLIKYMSDEEVQIHVEKLSKFGWLKFFTPAFISKKIN